MGPGIGGPTRSGSARRRPRSVRWRIPGRAHPVGVFLTAEPRDFGPALVPQGQGYRLIRVSEVIPDDSAGRRILARRACRALPSKRAASNTFPESNGVFGPEQTNRVRENARIGLAEHSQVVEDPERSTVRGNDKIIVLYHHVANRHYWKIRLPTHAMTHRRRMKRTARFPFPA